MILNDLGALGFAAAALYVAVGCYRVKRCLRFAAAVMALTVAVLVWRAGSQPWHWRWY